MLFHMSESESEHDDTPDEVPSHPTDETEAHEHPEDGDKRKKRNSPEEDVTLLQYTDRRQHSLPDHRAAGRTARDTVRHWNEDGLLFPIREQASGRSQSEASLRSEVPEKVKSLQQV